MLQKEAIVWRQFNHPHVLEFLGFGRGIFQDDDRLCLVSPWMANGTLCEYIRKSGPGNAQVDPLRLVRDTRQHRCLTAISNHPDQMLEIASALAYLHSCKVVHGDLHGVSLTWLPICGLHH
jgi:serine/threonine protein kinase